MAEMVSLIPALPRYRGPSHAVEVLERVAQRETLRLGLPWTDMTNAERNRELAWAATAMDEALRCLWNDPLIAELRTIPAGGVRTFMELDCVECWLNNRLADYATRVEAIRHFRKAIGGRER